MFMLLYKKAKANNDKHLKKFLSTVLKVYDEYNINSQIKWKDDE